jgi:hypothetical protein
MAVKNMLLLQAAVKVLPRFEGNGSQHTFALMSDRLQHTDKL